MSASNLPEGWPHKFQDTETIRFSRAPTEEVAAWWNRRFLATARLFPEDFVSTLSDGAPGRINGVFAHIDPVAETFEFDLTGIADDTTRIFLKSKQFEIASGRVGDGETRVHPDWQRKRIGTQLMSNLIEVGQQLQLNRIDIEAQDIGRYAWLALGFLPERTAWRDKIVPAARRKLTMIFATGAIDQNVFNLFNEVLKDTDARAIRRAMEFRQPVPFYGDPRGGTTISLFKDIMLQEGTDWFGSFDLRDPDSLALFEAWRRGYRNVRPEGA